MGAGDCHFDQQPAATRKRDVIAIRARRKRPACSTAPSARRTSSLARLHRRHQPLQHELPDLPGQHPGDGFRFDPPMEYFEKIFQVLAAREPKPKIQLFGGEPTVRQDLIEMIELAKKKYGLSARVVDQRLQAGRRGILQEAGRHGDADHVLVRRADQEVNDRTRKHSTRWPKKLKALENLKKSANPR